MGIEMGCCALAQGFLPRLIGFAGTEACARMRRCLLRSAAGFGFARHAQIDQIGHAELSLAVPA